MKLKILMSLICFMSFGINGLLSQPPSIPCPDDKIIGNKIYEWVAPGIWRYKADLGAVSTLNCASPANNGTLEEGVAASGVSSVISYTVGNGGPHPGQTVISTGVTGLTATLAAGTFANGAGTVTYTITGTPGAAGIASFALNIGGQSCTLTRNVNASCPPSVYCGGTSTVVADVTNPSTGETWMNRNLGASQVATSSTDALSYGDLYQWGRLTDGHQCRNSGTTSVLSTTDTPGHCKFITASALPNDWRNPQNNNLWQGVNGVNNPCPSGYRIPTEAEWTSEFASWGSNSNAAGAFASPLKLPVAGYRTSDGLLTNDDVSGYYWSSTLGSSTLGSATSKYLFISSGIATTTAVRRANGLSVRCIKN